jgi:transcriptional regulator of met regulon
MVKRPKPGESGAGREIVAHAAHGRNFEHFSVRHFSVRLSANNLLIKSRIRRAVAELSSAALSTFIAENKNLR